MTMTRRLIEMRQAALALLLAVSLTQPAAAADKKKFPQGPRFTEQPGTASLDVTIADKNVHPESLTADAQGNLYASSLKGIIYRAEPGSDTARPWIRPDDTNKLLWVLGVLADDKANTLWACTTPAPFRNPPALGEAAVVAFDLKTGAFKARYPLPAPASACNDIAIAKDGTAFIAETTNGRMFTLAPGASAVSLLVQDKLLVGVDGIAFSDDGLLYVNNVQKNSMFRVNRASDGAFASLTQLMLSEPVNGPDGLRPIGGNCFLQAEGPGNRMTLLTITGDKVDIKLIENDIPGTAAVTRIGNVAYTAEGKINYLFDPKLKGQDPGAFVIRAVPLDDVK
jgi:sugar lactone lactonase YvrE